ncbi:uncharacterized protein BJX67DRAFT_121211 [Aspergillus lucknowensis]|uniref:Uncharacterized protein n=1 Tax=Aspergillus lucknowensis TaxID=176173 RepID=A0ABR4LQ41_9EURO
MGKRKKSEKPAGSDVRHDNNDSQQASSIFAHVYRTLARLTTGSQATPRKMTFFIDWELNQFVRSRLDGSWDELRALKLTPEPSNDNGDEAEVPTCEEYIVRNWGHDGIGILTRITECYEYNKPIPHKTHLRVRYGIKRGDKDHDVAPDLVIDAEGKPGDLINMAKLFSWLTGTFTMIYVGRFTYSYREPWIMFHDSSLPYCSINPNWKCSPDYNWESRQGSNYYPRN